MPPKVPYRDVNASFQILRNFLLGRKHTLAVRHEDEMSPRTQPQPVLPDGPAHGLSANYYYPRDARREVTPPITVAFQPLLESSKKGEQPTGVVTKSRTPGPTFRWDDHHY